MKYKIINKKKLIATIFADIAGYVIFSPFKLFKRKININPQDIKNILIIRTAYIGDIIMTIPILKPIKDRFPNSRITFLASKGGVEILKGNPYIDRLLPFNPFWFYKSSFREYIKFIKELKRKNYDIIIEARGDIRDILFLVFPLKSKVKLSYGFGGGAYCLTHVVPFKNIKHRIEYHLDLISSLNCDTSRLEWGIYLTEAEENRTSEILNENGIKKPFVSAHPGSRLPLKIWEIDRYAETFDSIISKYNMPLAILGADSEMSIVSGIKNKMKNNPVILAGKLSLRELAGVIGRSRLFISNDSAPMHIASAMKTPTVAIFGPSKSIETSPYGNQYNVVEKSFECRYNCDENSCFNNNFHLCMRSIQVNDVTKAVDNVLFNSGG